MAYPFGTVTVESALVTPYAMYLSWEIALNESAPMDADDVLFSSVNLYAGANGSLGAHEVAGTRGDDGAYHFAAIMQSGQSTIPGDTYSFWNISLAKRPSGGGEPTYYQVSLHSTEQEAIRITIADSTDFNLIQPGVTLHTEYCDATYFAVSPLGITFTNENGADPQKLLHETGGLSYTEAELHETFTASAVYADGTMQPLTTTQYCLVYSAEAAEQGYRYFLIFDKPLVTENLTAIVINGTEIPLK